MPNTQAAETPNGYISRMASGIYEIRHEPSGGYYIGSSSDIMRRLRQHFGDLTRGDHRNAVMQRTWNKYGGDGWTGRCLVIASTDDLLYYEQRFLDAHYGEPGCFNLSRDADSVMRGRHHTPEAKAKMRAAKVGRTLTPEHRAKVSAAGMGRKSNARQLAVLREGHKHLTDESRAKISVSLTGRKLTPEHIEKSAAARRGKPGPKPSAETRAKMSASRKGKPLTDAQKAAIARVAEGNRGRPRSRDAVERTAAAQRGQKRPGVGAKRRATFMARYGQPFAPVTDEARERMRVAAQRAWAEGRKRSPKAAAEGVSCPS